MSTNKIRSVYFAVKVPSADGLTVTAKEYTLPQNPDIEDAARIISIEAYHSGIIPKVFEENGAPVITLAVLRNAKLVLRNSNNTVLREIPLVNICVTDGRYPLPKTEISGLALNKCQIVVPVTTGITVGEYFLFFITYEQK